jgi:hypothetical protein
MKKLVHILNASILGLGAFTNEDWLIIISMIISVLSILYDYLKAKEDG